MSREMNADSNAGQATPAYACDGAEILDAASLAIRALPAGASVTRVFVAGVTESTQDLARAQAQGSPGLVVMAEHQTKGRGRLGRQWADISMKSLPATFVVGPGRSAAHLSLAAGLAACRTIESVLHGLTPVGIRWPNDVVERDGAGPHASGRKLSGVLIEAADGVHLVGIGINVAHTDADWPEPLRATACSLRQLGVQVSRAQVAAQLIAELDRCLASSPDDLASQWRERNVLLGRVCGFVHDGRTHTGIVRDIDPANAIVIEDTGGETIRLPALTTSLLK
ncbi:MAG: biotin--[acetyl-CoA-carboxylase] ligase [Tepidisphaera sp.]|nr:biotin--[acetyl-CoA-carboxylase] ligase [Tepidisphaera sp.]